MAWGITSVIGIALSGVISVSVPFFDIIVAAIGALGDLAAAYALPALFVLVRETRTVAECTGAGLTFLKMFVTFFRLVWSLQ